MRTTKADLEIEIADLNFRLSNRDHFIAELERSLKLENEDRAALQSQLGSVREDLQHATMQLAAKNEQLVNTQRALQGLSDLYNDLHKTFHELLVANSEMWEQINTPLTERVAKWFKAA